MTGDRYGIGKRVGGEPLADIGNAPDPRTVEGWPGAPRYFVRNWGDLTIWGFACRSSFAEDEPQERASWEQQRAFMAWCFSEVEPDGELGFVRESDVSEISEGEFWLARQGGW